MRTLGDATRQNDKLIFSRLVETCFFDRLRSLTWEAIQLRTWSNSTCQIGASQKVLVVPATGQFHDFKRGPRGPSRPTKLVPQAGPGRTRPRGSGGKKGSHNIDGIGAGFVVLLWRKKLPIGALQRSLGVA